jgi:hypothetical protein
LEESIQQLQTPTYIAKGPDSPIIHQYLIESLLNQTIVINILHLLDSGKYYMGIQSGVYGAGLHAVFGLVTQLKNLDLSPITTYICIGNKAAIEP